LSLFLIAFSYWNCAVKNYDSENFIVSNSESSQNNNNSNETTDDPPPILNFSTSINHDSENNSLSLSPQISWNNIITDSSSYIFEIAVGSTPGNNDIFDWTPNGVALFVTLSNLALENGKIYYPSIRIMDDQGDISLPVTSAGWTVDVDVGPGPFLVAGLYSSNVDLNVDAFLDDSLNPSLGWENSEGAYSYLLTILNEDKSMFLCSALVLAPAVLHTFDESCLLSLGKIYFANIKAVDDNGAEINSELRFFTRTSSSIIVDKTVGGANADFESISQWETRRDGDLIDRQVLRITNQTGKFNSNEIVTGTGGCAGKVIIENVDKVFTGIMTLQDISGNCEQGDLLTGASSGATATFIFSITTAGTIERALVRKGVYAENVNISGSTTGRNNYMWITTDANNHHNGIAGTGVVITPNNTGHAVRVNDRYTVVENIEITGWKSNNSESFEGVSVQQQDVFLGQLIVHDDIALGSNPNSDGINLNEIKTNGGRVTIRNTVVYNISRGGIIQQTSAPNSIDVIIENCTVFRTGILSGADGNGGIDFRRTGTTAVIINTISMANYDSKNAEGEPTGNDFKLGEGAGSRNNMGSKNSVGDNGVLATPFTTFSNANGFNLSLKPDSQAIDHGVDLSDQFDMDIKLDPRPNGNGFDIGAFESF